MGFKRLLFALCKSYKTSKKQLGPSFLDASFISDNTATCTTSTGSGGCTSAWSAVWTSSPPRPSMTRAQAGLPSLMSSTKRTFARGRTHPEVKIKEKNPVGFILKFVSLFPVGGNLLRIIADPSLIRTEVSCKECGSHLGHVFEVKTRFQTCTCNHTDAIASVYHQR